MDSEAKRQKLVLEQLSIYQKQGALETDWSAMSALLTNESDRGVAVIVGSLVEDALLERIVGKLPGLDKDQRKNLTRSGGVLSSFAARVSMASALGLIDDETAILLDILKAVRNACAHSRRDINFKTPELKAAIGLMLESGDDTEGVFLRSEDDTFLRLVFLLLASYLFDMIGGASKDEATDRINRLMAKIQEAAEKKKEQLEASRRRRTERRAKADQ